MDLYSWQKGLQCFSSLFYSREKEILQRKEIPVDKNTAHAQACAPTKKSDVELLRENEEKFNNNPCFGVLVLKGLRHCFIYHLYLAIC